MLVPREVNAASRYRVSDTGQPRIYIVTTVKSFVVQFKLFRDEEIIINCIRQPPRLIC